MRTEVYPDYVQATTYESGAVSVWDPDNGNQYTEFRNAEQAHSWLCNHGYKRITPLRASSLDGLYRRLPGGGGL